MATTDPRDALEAGAKQWLSELSDDEFTSLVNEVREPESDTPTITKGCLLYTSDAADE